MYTAYKLIVEHDYVSDVLLPTLEELIPTEEVCDVQYQVRERRRNEESSPLSLTHSLTISLYRWWTLYSK